MGERVHRVTDLIDPQLLREAPPRRLPLPVIASLAGRRLSGIASRVLLDPWLVSGLGVILLLLLLGAAQMALLLLLLLLLRVWMRWRGIVRELREDILLLREGRVLRAVVLRAKVNHTISGQVDGVYLDCAIPIDSRRTHLGSVWLADGGAAMELARRGSVVVLCLVRSPGIWRLLEGGAFEIRSSGGLTEEQRDLMRED
jgi:hypothetical protein